MNQEHVVIVGSGQASGEVSTALRGCGYKGSITIIGDEEFAPYGRPPLSKAYLLGEVEVDKLLLRPPSAYERHDIKLIVGVRVTAIDRTARQVALSDGRFIAFDHLVLATGGRPRQLDSAELSAAPNVLYLRTIADADRLRRVLVAGKRLVIVGGGYIGLEIAAAAVRTGLEVTLLEAAERVLARVTSPVVSQFFERIHREEGADIRVNACIDRFILGDDRAVVSIRLKDGEVIPVDALLIGVGLVPNTELAKDAGLDVDNGIIVDGHCRTRDAAIFAIGDCSRHPDPVDGSLRRLESVPNAVEQARIVASAICGVPAVYESVPWFWSDQYDVKLKTVGVMQSGDEAIVRGSIDAGRSFTVFYLRNGAVAAADVVSGTKDFAAARMLVSRRAVIVPDRLRDESISLKDIAAAAC